MHLNQNFPSSQPPLRSRKKKHVWMSRDRLDELEKVNSEGETSLQMGRKHFYGTTLNTVTPCAACKLLRRRCAEECPFSPYFSPHEPQKFAAVHKVFGASNVSKLLMEVPEGQRGDAANSMVYEANLRLRDPIYGCMGAISSLQQQVQSLQAELQAIRAEILKYKYREATNFISSNHSTLVSSMPNSTQNSSQPLSSSSSSLPLPKLLPSHESIILSSLSSSSASNSVYTSNKSTMSHGSISSENIPYFV